MFILHRIVPLILRIPGSLLKASRVAAQVPLWSLLFIIAKCVVNTFQGGVRLNVISALISRTNHILVCYVAKDSIAENI